MTLETEFERVSLPLENPFTIFRGTQTDAENVIVKIADEAGMTGVGGAAPSAHYGETADTVEAVLPDLLDAVERVGDPPHALHEIEAELAAAVVNGNPPPAPPSRSRSTTSPRSGSASAPSTVSGGSTPRPRPRPPTRSDSTRRSASVRRPRPRSMPATRSSRSSSGPTETAS